MAHLSDQQVTQALACADDIHLAAKQILTNPVAQRAGDSDCDERPAIATTAARGYAPAAVASYGRARHVDWRQR